MEIKINSHTKEGKVKEQLTGISDYSFVITSKELQLKVRKVKDDALLGMVWDDSMNVCLLVQRVMTFKMLQE